MVAAPRMVVVQAKPEPINIDIARSAVLVIDMQNDFGAEGGMFDRAGIDISPIKRAVVPTANALAAARANSLPVIYLKMQHRADLSDFGNEDSPHRIKHQRLGVGETAAAPDGSPSRILIADNWGTEIVPELAPQVGDVIVSKHRYSGFFETGLDSILRMRNVKHLIVTGCTTSVCVESTIRDAMFRDYQCILLADCTGEPIGSGNMRGNHEASLLTIELLLGWVSESAHFKAALAG